MFERFTPAARRVVVLSQEEARMLHHNHIGPEHVLLGVLHAGEGDGARLLAEAGVTLEGARRVVEDTIGTGSEAASGAIPFTSSARRLLDAAVETALEMASSVVTEDHILLAVLRDSLETGVPFQIISALGASKEQLASELEEKLKSQDQDADAGTPVGEALSVFKAAIGQDLGIPHAQLKAAMVQALRAAKLAEAGLVRSA